MKTNTENKLRNRIRERGAMTPKFTWKTSEEIKNHRPTTDKKRPLWKTKTEYKVLPSSSELILHESLD